MPLEQYSSAEAYCFHIHSFQLFLSSTWSSKGHTCAPQKVSSWKEMAQISRAAHQLSLPLLLSDQAVPQPQHDGSLVVGDVTAN